MYHLETVVRTHVKNSLTTHVYGLLQNKPRTPECTYIVPAWFIEVKPQKCLNILVDYKIIKIRRTSKPNERDLVYTYLNAREDICTFIFIQSSACCWAQLVGFMIIKQFHKRNSHIEQFSILHSYFSVR